MDSGTRGRITAVLGPTNTGKTHLAIERMLGHRSGIIGFPLRLLARENYDRALRIKGPRQVALVTGEEKIVPPGARYFFCTVESMPIDRPVDFLAIDEIQLAADPERGHVFTDRLLKARGLQETMFLGAATIARLIRELVPAAEHVSRPRLSTLSYSGPRKVTSSTACSSNNGEARRSVTHASSNVVAIPITNENRLGSVKCRTRPGRIRPRSSCRKRRRNRREASASRTSCTSRAQ